MYSGTQISHACITENSSNSRQAQSQYLSPDDMDHPARELLRAGEVLLQLGERHRNARDNALAEVCYLRALDVLSKALPSNHPLIATTRDSLATMYRARGQLSVAESLQRTAVADLRRHFGDEPHQQLAGALRNLAETCLLSGKIQEGLGVLAEAVDMAKQLNASETEVYNINSYQAQILSRLG